MYQTKIRVLHLGNTNNIGYEIASALQAVGVESTLYVDKTEFFTSDPSWEQEDLSRGGRPDWVRYYRNLDRHKIRLGNLKIRFPYFHRLQQLLDLIGIAHEYDVLQAYNYDVVLCLSQPHKAYIAFCIGGDLNVTALKNGFIGFLMRSAYRHARYVFYSNINMIDSVRKLKLKNAYFMPLPINTGKYVPSNQSDLRRQLGCEVLLFSPTRHDWATKGNDKFITALAKLVCQSPVKIKIILCQWGQDIERSRSLCSQLGLDPYVVWHPLMPKGELIKFYQAADIVIDQFNVGAFGLVTLEAMSCAKPVIVGYNKNFASACYPELPPLRCAVDSEEIFHTLKELIENPEHREELGYRSREWVVKYHGRIQVAQRHLEFYRTMLGKE
ncbi:MAG: glycosyltransferase [Candidatus Methanomethylicaceae archaeon]